MKHGILSYKELLSALFSCSRGRSEGQNGVTSCSTDEANMSVMQNCYLFRFSA